MKRQLNETITSFTHTEDVNGVAANMLSLFEPPVEFGEEVLLFASHTFDAAKAPEWAVLDEEAVDELIEHLMIWKIRKKARDGGN